MSGVSDGTGSGDVLIEVRNLSKSFGQLEVLRNIDLDVRRGEVVCIIGPSGSGKSTLLRCLNRLEDPTTGIIRIGGEEITERSANLSRLRRKVGMVFQHFNLFPHMTALENVMVGPVHVRGAPKKRARQEALELLDRVRLLDRADHYPHELSGGQQQRVAIARALAMRPKVMLFDEPTSALDAELVREVIDVMEELARDGMTMIVVSHELRFAHEAADAIVMMADGQVIEEAPPDRFFTSPQHERTRQFLQVVG